MKRLAARNPGWSFFLSSALAFALGVLGVILGGVPF
jgi:hypothetical protein